MLCRKTILFSLLLAACKTTNSSQVAEDDTTQSIRYPSPIQEQEVNQNFKSGDLFQIKIDPNRRVKMATIKYHGSYKLYERDAAGVIKTNHEGQPRFRDGMYAYGYIVDEKGNEKSVATRKFIDAQETDNWYDLTPMAGKLFRIKFSHHENYVNDPEVKKAKTTIELRSIKIQYEDQEGETYKQYSFAENDKDEFDDKAIKVKPGTSHVIKVPTKNIYRIDVRWGDAKPENQQGKYVPGLASGSLKVDGKIVDKERNVAAIETQVWLDIPKPSASQKERTIELLFRHDVARVFWIRVYSYDR